MLALSTGSPCGHAGPSQQVDDVGKKDEAHDGEKHQHQNVHHDENTARDGCCGREKDTQHNSSWCKRSCKIVSVRGFTERDDSA